MSDQDPSAPKPFRARATYWRWPGKHTASKRFFVDNEGRLQKVSPSFRAGLGAILNLSLAQLAAIAQDPERPALMIYSLPQLLIGNGEKFVIASSAEAAAAHWRADRIFKAMPPEMPVATRTSNVLARPAGEPGFILIDVDDKGVELQDVLDALYEIVPELRVAPMLCMPSSSSYVALEGEDAGPAGWHIVIGIADASDAARALQVMWERLWLVPGAHKAVVTAAGSVELKTFVDLAMRSVTQPHFLQRPIVGDGVCRSAPDALLLNQNAEAGLDTRVALPDLSPGERAAVAVAQEIARSKVEDEALRVREEIAQAKARQMVERGEADSVETAIAAVRREVSTAISGYLSLHHRLHFDRFGWVTAAEVLDDPGRFNGETLEDPVEPQYGGVMGRPGRNKAVCSVRGSRVTITSMAHSDGAHGRKFLGCGTVS